MLHQCFKTDILRNLYQVQLCPTAQIQSGWASGHFLMQDVGIPSE